MKLQKKGHGYTAPVLVTILAVAFAAGFMALLVWAVAQSMPPLPVLLYLGIYILAGAGVIGGVLYCLRQRIHEIQKGEEDEARKY